MPSALENLVKILKLEREQGYRNTAVIGGLGAFGAEWEPRAHQQAKIDDHHILVEDLSELLRRYDAIDGMGDRHEVVSYMLDRIIGRIPPREDFQPTGDWATAQPSPPPPEPEPEPYREPEPEPEPQREPEPIAEVQAPPAPPPQPKRQPKQPRPPQVAPARPPRPVADVPEPLRLERPPRRPRVPMDPDEAADIMGGLRESVTVVKGVGEKLADTLANINIHTLEDLLYYLPRRHDDYTRLTPIQRVRPGETVTLIGTVRKPHTRTGRNNRKDFACVLDDGTADLSLIFFGQQFLIRQIKEGQQIVVSGQTSVYGKRLQMSSPEWEHLDGDNLHTIGIVPVYRLTKGLNPRRFRKLMRDAVQYWSEKLPDYVPEATLDRGELADLGWALRNVHFPESHDHLMHARRRLVFDELLLMQLAILGNRREWQSVPAQALEVADEFLDKFIEAAFPYDLTGAQQRAVDDIRRDVGLDVPMNRLIQGDVGSGKTAVATIALAMAFANGKQAALMAPTGILAEQHYRGVSETLEAMPGSIKPVVALLTGAIAKAERERVYAGLADGTIDVVIGTHAVIQEGVEFADLGLAIIDEQHRFGVEQRGTLRGKGENPHLLVMTATPIPRTLALTLYADLDLSVIDEMPPGRTPTKTRIRQPVEREQVYDFIEAQMEKGRQAFIVHPLVEASETIEAEAALDAFERLKDVFHRYNVGLLHGRMKPAEKDEAMYAFGEGYYDILVTTSVAEVGVNVPNASVMMIEGANRFGLSQLHQFRGRVGRGQHPGYCLLIPDKKFNDAEVQMLTSEGILNPTDDTDVDEALAKLEALTGHIDVSLQRLAAMELTSDGFKLAEIDWRLRGAGDLLGVSQSGGNKLQLMETMDPEMVSLSQREAKTIYADDLWLEAEEHALLRQRVQQIIDARSDVS